MDYYRRNDTNRYYHVRDIIYGNDGWKEDDKSQVDTYDARMLTVDEDDHFNDSGHIEDYNNSDKDDDSYETRNERFSDSSTWSTEPEDVKTRI